jgi:YesN/AraC family two-component response regulator
MAEKASANEIMEIENLIELADKTIENLLVHDLCEIVEEIIRSVMSLQKEEYTGTIRDVVRQAVKYIETNFFEELTLTDIADRFGVESSYFSKIFRKETGYNMMFYITNLRIEKAKEYMSNSNINLTEIAFMVGYDDYTYFSKVFRKMTGKSPRDYRNTIDLK